MTTGQIIQTFRKEKGYTQKQIAEKCGMATGTIQQYELNKREPRQEQLRKIADALGVDPFSLYSFDMASEALEKNIDKKESSLLDSYRQLSPLGQDKAIEHVELLTKIPEYRKEG